MPEPKLPPAAEAFIRTHVFASRWDEAEADLAALLETVRAEEREACAKIVGSHLETCERIGSSEGLAGALLLMKAAAEIRGKRNEA